MNLTCSTLTNYLQTQHDTSLKKSLIYLRKTILFLKFDFIDAHTFFGKCYIRSNALSTFRYIFVERFLFALELGLSFGNHTFIWVEFLSLEHVCDFCKKPVVAGGQICRGRWVEKQFEACFIQINHHQHVVVFGPVRANLAPILKAIYACLIVV